ncbi:MAG: hypothetical protein ACJ8FY_26775 [Gemmataceae bacterium]
MNKNLQGLAGLVIAVASVIPILWALDAFNSIKTYKEDVKLGERQIERGTTPREKAEEKIAEAQKEIERRQKEGAIGVGCGVAALVVGLGLLAWPSSKRRNKVAPDPITSPAPVTDSSAVSDQPPT